MPPQTPTPPPPLPQLPAPDFHEFQRGISLLGGWFPPTVEILAAVKYVATEDLGVLADAGVSPLRLKPCCAFTSCSSGSP